MPGKDVVVSGTLDRGVVIDGLKYAIEDDYVTVLKSAGLKGDVTIPSSVEIHGSKYDVTTISHGAFYCCSDITSVIIPNSVESIEYMSFYKCSGLESIVFPDGLKSIGSQAFSYCTSLKAINLPNSLEKLGFESFYGCSSLESLTIPNSVTRLDAGAFAGCTNLKILIVGSGLKEVGGGTPMGDISRYHLFEGTNLQSLTLFWNDFGDMFNNLKNLKELFVQAEDVCIVDNAFSGCSSLETIEMGNGVKSIGNNAFAGCRNLRTIDIGKDIQSIGERAFANIDKLTDVTILAGEIPNTDRTAFENSYIEDYVTLHVPDGSLDKYKSAAPWKNFKEIVGISAPSEPSKCATPYISIVGNKVTFECKTEGVTYHYNVSCSYENSGDGDSVELQTIYNVSVYATKDGYIKSDMVTEEIKLDGTAIGGQSGGINGDTNGDGVVNAADIVNIMNQMFEGRK